MTTQDTSTQAQRSGILGWLGLNRGETAPVPVIPRDAMPSLDALSLARQEKIAEISRFILAKDLDVTSFTLSLAHDYLSGQDQRLVKTIDAKALSGEAITVEWLETALKPAKKSEDTAVVAALMGKLQTNLEEFGRTTTAAKSAASDYSSALELQVDEIQRTSVSGAVVADLANLAQTMLERTRELEKELSRSDQQTKALQKSLAQARLTAERDHLTGLPNRRAFEARLTSEFTAAKESGEPLCIAFCDIDHFKSVNDTHGHEAGDRILKTVAQNLARISNKNCHVARHGGEEFVVLFRGKSVHECWELLDDCRTKQAERVLVNRATDVPFGKVTFSAGLTDIFAFPDPRSALRAADQALYRAKEKGRNRVIIGTVADEE